MKRKGISMKSCSHFRLSLVALALVMAVARPARAADSCLSGDSLPADAAAIAALRGAIDDACPCDGFDGSEGGGKADFKRCVSGQIRLAVDAGDLRKACKGRVKKVYAASVCGSG